ncbi:MAG: Uma2 family endonuclease [Polyangiaceae bacterium]|nr:Uma2 family endonuclease [Polyangiaceae bacterium]
MAQSLPSEIVVRYRVPGFSEQWTIPEGVVPEAPWHFASAGRLYERLARRFASSGRAASAFRNLAVRVRQDLPSVGFDPDVCVVEPSPPDAASLDSLRLWQPGHPVPRLVVEIVSKGHPSKDYVEVPDQCAAAGVEELVVFDPKRLGPRAHGGRKLLQLWRRAPEGGFESVFSGDEPARSSVLGAWLIPSAEHLELLIADDAEGREPWLTSEEAERGERAAKDAERAAKESALARVAELEAELAKRP